MNELIVIVLIGLVFWFWRDSMISREAAMVAGQRACNEVDAQFLDQTVVLRKIKLCRSRRGNTTICRTYSFDFTVDGETRLLGCVFLRGQTLEDLVLDMQHNA